MKKIPYGISNYHKIKSENYYFVDKTKFIELLENLGAPYLFLLRPRRFGKSLFISVLEHYYDILAKDKFDTLFGDTYIGQNPTPLRNSYPVLKFNFSMVRVQGTIENIRHSFNLHVLTEIELFLLKYAEKYTLDLKIIEELKQEDDAGDILQRFTKELRSKNIYIYLIIDEYDNFANNVLIEYKSDAYQEITHSGGFLRNFFTIIKGLTDSREIDRLFISGVSPLVMADVTSGFNIGNNISLKPDFASMVGLTNPELKELIEHYLSGQFVSLQPLLSEWYGKYCFDMNLSEKHIYNTTSILFFLQEYLAFKRLPSNLIDKNLRTDYGKLRYLILEGNKLNGNFNILKQILENGETQGELVDNFAVGELVNHEKFRSLLYYLGLITIKEELPINQVIFKAPNKLIKILLWEYMQNALEDAYGLRINIDFIKKAFDNMAKIGEWKPTLQYILDKFYEAVSIRDFVFHEEGLKTFLLAWLNLTNLYEVISEKEMNKGYADISLTSDRRFTEYINYEYIIELKYIKAQDAETPEKEEKAVAKVLKEAEIQLAQYTANEKFKTIKIVMVVSPKKMLYLEQI